MPDPLNPAALAIAHRAGNSLADLQRAVALGADVIEADVHDYRGRLEIRHLKTMGPLPWLWDQWELRSAREPRLGLEELLTAADHGVTFMLDLKGEDAAVGEKVAQQLHAYAPDRPVLVCTKYWPALEPFERMPWVRTILSARKRTEFSRLLARVEAQPPGRNYGASIHRSLLDPNVVATLHRRLEVVMTWPVNDARSLESVLALQGSGTIGVISDELSVLRQLLATRP